MLPNTAMPSAPLNSDAVSEIAEAAPARSGGAAVMIISLPSVNTGAMPEAHHDRAGDERRQAARAVGQRQQREADAAATQAADHHRRPADSAAPAAASPASRRRSASAHGTVARPGLQRRQAEHELQVLRDEDVDAEHREAATARRPRSPR